MTINDTFMLGPLLLQKKGWMGRRAGLKKLWRREAFPYFPRIEPQFVRPVV